ncbi:Uncharacterised protein [Acinetobacter baumannii]|uniref:hypothetical protein n=1 Tax=Acinetobacter baumannii TaxID=470 RepID=UPI000DE6CE34|nr:Uncharacterised protein [Acinetobacter baumannii]SSQ35188.1 Uncharacterised protein [Acinetobacter baumannii]SSS24014.1 Uncharacterised protein [Acinetobacter baumannii]
MPGTVIIRPAVPTEMCKSAATLFKTPTGKNSLVTKAKAAMATAKIANQLPCVEVMGRALEVVDWSIKKSLLC